MSEEEIRILLRDENIRSIARFCRTPRTSKEIIEHILFIRKSTNRELYETVIADALRKMEDVGIITFENGRWKTKEFTNQVLGKYYGE